MFFYEYCEHFSSSFFIELAASETEVDNTVLGATLSLKITQIYFMSSSLQDFYVNLDFALIYISILWLISWKLLICNLLVSQFNKVCKYINDQFMN